MSEIRPRLSGQRRQAYENLTRDERRILIIGDIHLPFSHARYKEHCVNIYNRFNCNQVIFIGDIIDNHYASYHETNPDGYGGGDELQRAIDQVQQWSKVFRVADVVIGNHDRLVMRKAFSSAIPQQWIKSYNEVLGTNWNWVDRIVYDDVQYVHGEGGTARTRAKNDMMSPGQGHIHTQSYVEWMVGNKFKIFGMQVGCGIDRNTYAAAYAKNYKKQALGCGVVIGGHTAINCLMDL